MGVIIKRPIANAVWRSAQKPENNYVLPYWERLQKLDYDFVKGDPARTAAIALKFSLSIPGVHTAIVGTANPGGGARTPRSWKATRSLPSRSKAIRTRWRETADPTWVGQI